MTISYCIPVCNEVEELDTLLWWLSPFVSIDDEVIVQVDSSKDTEPIYEVLEKFPSTTVIQYRFDGNFAALKNNLISNANGDYIVLIDADELPALELLGNLKGLLEENPDVELFNVPRFNVVKGLTEEWKKKWRWRTTYLECKERQVIQLYNLPPQIELVNLPDYQSRIFKNEDRIFWSGKVHERLVGYNTFVNLPFETFDFGFWHVKEIERQIRQNELYDNIA